MGKKEKRALIAFVILCFFIPFVIVGNPLEIASGVLPLWLNYYGAIALWAYRGKPLWQAFLACYAISSLGIILVYFGIDIPRIIFCWIRKKSPAKAKEKKRNKLTQWLKGGPLWLILLFLLLPIPLTDPAAAIAMKLKGTKHGLWYLLAANVPHISLIVWGVYEGVEFFPAIIEFFKRLFA